MRVVLKLFASLTERLPPGSRPTHQVELDVDPGSTVQDVIRGQGIPEALCAIVLVDGVWVDRQVRPTQVLSEGQALAIWPPVAGG